MPRVKTALSGAPIPPPKPTAVASSTQAPQPVAVQSTTAPVSKADMQAAGNAMRRMMGNIFQALDGLVVKNDEGVPLSSSAEQAVKAFKQIGADAIIALQNAGDPAVDFSSHSANVFNQLDAKQLAKWGEYLFDIETGLPDLMGVDDQAALTQMQTAVSDLKNTIGGLKSSIEAGTLSDEQLAGACKAILQNVASLIGGESNEVTAPTTTKGLIDRLKDTWEGLAQATPEDFGAKLKKCALGGLGVALLGALSIGFAAMVFTSAPIIGSIVTLIAVGAVAGFLIKKGPEIKAAATAGMAKLSEKYNELKDFLLTHIKGTETFGLLESKWEGLQTWIAGNIHKPAFIKTLGEKFDALKAWLSAQLNFEKPAFIATLGEMVNSMKTAIMTSLSSAKEEVVKAFQEKIDQLLGWVNTQSIKGIEWIEALRSEEDMDAVLDALSAQSSGVASQLLANLAKL